MRNELLDAAFPYPIYREDAPEVDALLARFFLPDPIGNRADQLQDRIRTLQLFNDQYVVEYIDVV